MVPLPLGKGGIYPTEVYLIDFDNVCYIIITPINIFRNLAYRLTFIEPRHYGVVFFIQKNTHTGVFSLWKSQII